MLLINFIRAVLVIAGTLLMLLGIFGMIRALADQAWQPAFSAFLGTLFAFWIVNVGLAGRLSGRGRKDPTATA